jgi:hypothetical protein
MTEEQQNPSQEASQPVDQAAAAPAEAAAKPAAYDLKELGAMIKAEAGKDGIQMAEETLQVLGKAVYVGLKAWAIESAKRSENKIDDFIAPFYNYADQFVLPQIEKIDLDRDGK